MKGLTLKASKLLEELIHQRFDKTSVDFLGLVPKISREKKIIFTTARNSLTSLFLQSLGHRDPSKSEEEALKIILRIANGYINGLRDRTTAITLQNVDAYLKNRYAKNYKPNSNHVKQIIDTQMDKASKHFKLIANSESNKTVNTATALQISRIAEEKNEKDPTVFFIVTIDDVTGDEEFVLHLLPDRITPRVWKLSEIGAEYHKKGDWNPSISGLHPNCRCKINYLAPGWGFNEQGGICYKGKGWDEFEYQRERYGLPREKNLEKMYKDKYGNWKLHYSQDEEGTEHPENKLKDNIHDHKIAHKANDGKLYWKQKYMKFGGQLTSPDQMDALHRNTWKRYVVKNNLKPDSKFRNTLVGLNKQIINDNDRHLHISGTSNNPNPNHTEMRQRHLINALSGKSGYSIEEVRHPKYDNHIGVRIKAERHPSQGLYETSWFWDGQSLKTEYDKPKQIENNFGKIKKKY